MMGQSGGNQNRLFYSFKLEDHVPANHLLRDIDRFLDLTDLRAYLAPFYSHTGRPSIDPELMIRMLIVGYCSATVPRNQFPRLLKTVRRQCQLSA
jgi:transposase